MVLIKSKKPITFLTIKDEVNYKAVIVKKFRYFWWKTETGRVYFFRRWMNNPDYRLNKQWRFKYRLKRWGYKQNRFEFKINKYFSIASGFKRRGSFGKRFADRFYSSGYLYFQETWDDSLIFQNFGSQIIRLGYPGISALFPKLGLLAKTKIFLTFQEEDQEDESVFSFTRAGIVYSVKKNHLTTTLNNEIYYKIIFKNILNIYKIQILLVLSKIFKKKIN